MNRVLGDGVRSILEPSEGLLVESMGRDSALKMSLNSLLACQTLWSYYTGS